jgi:hypothetical protein
MPAVSHRLNESGSSVTQNDHPYRSDHMARRNAMVYRDPLIVTSYANERDLHLDEQAILRLIQADIVGQPILDIGIGGGRTTSHLLALTTE